MDDFDPYKHLTTDTGVITLNRNSFWYDEIAMIAQAENTAWAVIGDCGTCFLHLTNELPELAVNHQGDHTVHAWHRTRNERVMVIRLGQIRDCYPEKYHLYQVDMKLAKMELL